MLIFRGVPNLRIPYVSCGMTISTTAGTAQPAAGLEIREAKGMGVYVKARLDDFSTGRTGQVLKIITHRIHGTGIFTYISRLLSISTIYSKSIQYHLMYTHRIQGNGIFTHMDGLYHLKLLAHMLYVQYMYNGAYQVPTFTIICLKPFK